jgi:hypothetical protein
VTLDDATLSSNATLSLSGEVSVTLSGATLSASAQFDNIAALSANLDGAVLSSDATLSVSGELVATLDDAFLYADGQQGNEASLSTALQDATLLGFGYVPGTGDLSATLGDVTLSSDADNDAGQAGDVGYIGLVVDPRGLSVIEWADYTTNNIEAFGVVGRLDSEDSWMEWAQNVASLSEMQRRGVPPPYMYSSWRDWALDFNRQFDQGL